MDYIVFNIVPIVAATLVAYGAGLVVRSSTGGVRAGVAGRAVTLVAQFWLAAILAGAVILAPTSTGAGPWTMAIGSAVVIWGGFVLPSIVGNHIARGLGAAAMAVDALYWLVVMAAQAAVLNGIGVGLPNPQAVG